MKKIAEIRMELECGGHIITYLPCKDDKDLLKKLKKRHKGDHSEFGHFSVEHEAVMYADYVIMSVH